MPSAGLVPAGTLLRLVLKHGRVLTRRGSENSWQPDQSAASDWLDLPVPGTRGENKIIYDAASHTTHNLRVGLVFTVDFYDENERRDRCQILQFSIIRSISIKSPATLYLGG